MIQTPNKQSREWTLEIVPAHANRISVLQGLVREIFVTMIPGTSSGESLRAVKIVKEMGFDPVPHLAARNFRDEDELAGFFTEMRQLGIKKVLLLAGGHAKAAGPFNESLDVLRSKAFRKSGLESVAIAGHPEGNPEDPNTWISLEKKRSALEELGIALEIVTQWSFSPEKVSDYLAELRRRGIDASVRVGIAGPASLKTLLKFAKVCGVNAAATVIRKQGFNMARLLVSNKPDRFISQIEGSSFFHLYPFGGLEKCANWLEGQRATESVELPLYRSDLTC